MQQQIDKTAFSPAIAQLAMPDSNSDPLYAIGQGISDYDKQGKLDRMFDIDVKSKELQTDANQFNLDTAKQKAPIEIENAQVNLDNAKYDKDVIKPLQTQSAQLAVDQKQTEKDSGAWDAENNSKIDQADIVRSNAQYADQKNQLDIDVSKANLANTGLSTQINALKLSAAKSEDAITQASYYFYTDTTGDGIINEKDFAAVKDKLKSQGIDEKFIDGAYLMARGNLAKVEEAESKSTKNLALLHKQGTVGDNTSKDTAKTLSLASEIDSMVKNYDSHNVGWIDGYLDDFSQKFDVGATKEKAKFMGATGLANTLQRNELFGAALSAGELKSANEWLPSRYNSEVDFQAKTKGLLEYYNTLIDNKFKSLPPEKQVGYYDTYKAYKADIADSLANIDKNWGINRRPQATTPTEGNGTKGNIKLSTTKDTNTTPLSKQGLPNPMNY